MTVTAPSLSWPPVVMQPCPSTSFTGPWASALYTHAPLWPPTTRAHTIGLQGTLPPHLFIHSVFVHAFVSTAPSYDGVSTTSYDPISMPTMLSSPNLIATSLGHLLEHLFGPHPSPLMVPPARSGSSPSSASPASAQNCCARRCTTSLVACPCYPTPGQFFYTATIIATTYRQPATAAVIDYTLHNGGIMEPSPIMVLCNHHYPNTTLIDHTLKHPTTPHGDILTGTYAPSITIDHSKLLIAKFIVNAWITLHWRD